MSSSIHFNRAAPHAPAEPIRVFVPWTDDGTDPLEAPLARSVWDLLIAQIGGATLLQGIGAWRRPDGGVIQEDVVLLESYPVEQLSGMRLTNIVELLKQRFQAYGEEVMGIVIEGRLNLIPLRPKIRRPSLALRHGHEGNGANGGAR